MRTAASVASFGYHEVTDEPGDSGFQRPSARAYKHSRAAFALHLDAIARGPAAPVLVTGLRLAEPARHVLLTFDDGGKSALYIGDALARRGWRGHFFIVTSLVGTRTFLSAAEVRELRAAGHLIGTHTHTHPTPFRDLPDELMRAEWRVSIDTLTQLLGEPCVTASVPGGDVSRRVFASADAAGIRWLFTSDPTLAAETIGDCVVLGRFVPKVSTSPEHVGRLAAFRGWRGALLRRRARNLLRDLLPGVYRAVLGRRDAAPMAAQ